MAEPLAPRSPDDELELPAVFGRYLLVRRLSRGGMGEIFLAKSGEVQGFEKFFVIKKILPDLSSNEEFSDRFADEAKITINLKHANIVPVFEVGMVGSDYFLALEHVEGRDLRRILSRCYEIRMALPPDLALLIAREAANGLSYAHRRKDDGGGDLGIVHCDISPPNILVSLEGEVRIIDFGVSRSADMVSRHDPGVGFGKFGYMAPEQILKGRDLDKRTDLYALGVVLYEMLVGDRMIEFSETDEYRAIARKVVLGDVPPPSVRRPELGTRFDDLVMRAISKDPSNRFQTAAEFRDQIQRHLLEENPTISADHLAEFLEAQFGPELAQEREIVNELKAADHSQYVLAINAQKEQTVSYAMTDIWSVSTESFGAVGPPLAQPQPSAAEDTYRPPQRKRWALYAGVGVAVAVLLVVLLVVLWPSGESEPEPGSAARAAGGGSRGSARVGDMTPARGAVDTRPVRPAEDRRRAVRERPVELRPVVVDSMRRRRPPRRRWRPRYRWRPPRRRTRTRPRSAMRPAVDAAEKKRVLAKYMRVKRQYVAFKAKYGERLERYWIRIARTAVYSGADRYKRLDRLLDDLAVRMARVRRSGQ